RVALAGSSSGGPVIFETSENLYAVGADMVAVQAFDGARYQVVTEFNRGDGKSFYPFGLLPQSGAALYLGFDRAFPAGPFQYPLTIHVDTYGQATVVQGAGPGAANLTPPVLAVWEYWSGDTTQWKPVTMTRDGTNALTRSGVVLFEPPTGFVAVKYGALKKT